MSKVSEMLALPETAKRGVSMAETEQELRFTVPLPPRALSPNSPNRHTWRLIGAVKKDYRRLVRMLATNAAAEARWSQPGRARVSLLAGTGPHGVLGLDDDRYRPRDHGNLVAAFKAGFDGMVDAALMADDDAIHMELWRVVIDPEREPGIEVVVVGVG